MVISTGASRTCTTWEQRNLSWDEFITLHHEQARTGDETHTEYMAMPKAEQDRRKDVGGFVGGALHEGRRKKGCCTERWLITLDADNIPAGGTDSVTNAVQEAGFLHLVYSTRKHDPEHPRLRIILPTSRAMQPDEYQPIARRIAYGLCPDMDIWDPTTFEPERLMYWQSSSKDSEVVDAYTEEWECEALDPDAVLARFSDWRDYSEWPQCPGEQAQEFRGDTQEDPTAKPGIVGAFCRAHDIHSAIATFIPDAYTPCGDGRYSYTQGSTTGGAVVYDDGRFIYSHHATDPASGQLCNAWDLVRIHLHGSLDGDTGLGVLTSQLPSFSAMCATAEADPATKALLTRERQEAAIAGFAAESPTPGDEADDWQRHLEFDKKGNLLSSIQNMRVIMEHDPALAGKVYVDRFAARKKCKGELPWPGPTPGERLWSDTDDDGLAWYFETVYHISGKDKRQSACNLTAEAHGVDPVVDYLEHLQWDGTPRLETMFIDYLGAEDTPYTRAVTRKSWTAAAARAFHPGRKFDQVVILSGPQGLGKSTILRKMGRNWFSDSVTSFSGKDAREAIQGVWVVELGELTALDKGETEACKQFISQTEDMYRPAYGRNTVQLPRRCVFFGTSNKDEFLRDTTGNRRFWPVDVGVRATRLSPFEDLTDDIVDQLWAEAVVNLRRGEDLYLDRTLAGTAVEVQDGHRESDPWEGRIREFLSKKVPLDWANWSEEERRSWWQDAFVDREHTAQVGRNRICVAEIWCELMGQSMDRLDSRQARRIGAALSNLPGWTKHGVLACGPYGRQKTWVLDATE